MDVGVLDQSRAGRAGPAGPAGPAGGLGIYSIYFHLLQLLFNTSIPIPGFHQHYYMEHWAQQYTNIQDKRNNHRNNYE